MNACPPEPHDPLLRNVPPHSLEAERCVLGAIMLNQRVLDVVRPIVGPAEFYSAAHETIYQAALDLHYRRQPVDVVSLNEHLLAKGVLNQVGGSVVLAELCQAVVSDANADYYAERVRDRAKQRRLIQAAAQIQKIAFEPVADVNALLAEAEAKLLSVTQQVRRHEPVTLQEAASQALLEWRRAKEEGVSPTIETGIHKLDDETDGISPGSVVVVGALSSHGKTALATTILRHVARTKPCCLISLEMRQLRIARGMLAAEARVDDADLRKGAPPRRDGEEVSYTELMEAVERCSPNLWLADCTKRQSRNLTQVLAEARRMVALNDCKVIVVDYVQLVTVETHKNKTREREVAEVSAGLRELADETGAAVIALAQLNKGAVRRKEPRIEDLRESSALEHDADQVWLLWRPGRLGSGDADSKAVVKVAKQREGGLGETTLFFDAPTRTFHDHDPKPRMG